VNTKATALQYWTPVAKSPGNRWLWLMATLGIFPIFRLHIVERKVLTHLQRQLGSTILTGSPQERIFLSWNEHAMTTVFVLEAGLTIATIWMVAARRWNRWTMLILFVYAIGLSAGVASWFILGVEGSP
jgi:hypothetical protein